MPIVSPVTLIYTNLHLLRPIIRLPAVKIGLRNGKVSTPPPSIQNPISNKLQSAHASGPGESLSEVSNREKERLDELK
jgi:hypothetical protein